MAYTWIQNNVSMPLSFSAVTEIWQKEIWLCFQTNMFQMQPYLKHGDAPIGLLKNTPYELK